MTAGGTVPVTVSIGGAALAGGEFDVGRELALRVADLNLYAAKDGGRDRCEVTPVG